MVFTVDEREESIYKTIDKYINCVTCNMSNDDLECSQWCCAVEVFECCDKHPKIISAMPWCICCGAQDKKEADKICDKSCKEVF